MQFEHDDTVRSTMRRMRIAKVDDSGTQQKVDLKGLKNEEPKKIYRAVDFGFFSVPPIDSEGLAHQMGGRSDRTIYQDGGHKDYRPRNRPAGSSGLFDQYGNLIQSDKDQLQHTHAKKIVLQRGKGYDAKDAATYSGPTVSIAFDGTAMVLTFDSASLRLDGTTATLTFGTAVVKLSADSVYVKPPPGKNVYLGGTGADGAYDFVTTASGDSINVKAKVS